MDPFAKYRKLPDAELDRLYDTTNDEELQEFIAEELQLRYYDREEAYEDARDNALDDPWWANA